VGIDLTTDTKHALIVGNLSSSCVRWNICIQDSLWTTLSATVKCWTMNSLCASKCKHCRNTRHTVTVVKVFLKHPAVGFTLNHD
jgi:hypothetical protein